MEELTMSTTYSIGAMNQLGDALEHAGFSSEDITKLKKFSDLKGFKDVLNGKAGISYPEHLIDCDANPFTPNSWSVEEHKKGGMLKFNPEKISLHLSKKQKKGSIEGNDLRTELAGQPALNANILDYLLANPTLIPEEWKDKYVCFWGTIYRDSDGDLCVRYLHWHGSKWGWRCYWLDDGFDSDDPAALAS